MDDALLERRVREIVADVTLNPPDRVDAKAAAGRLEGWDSLAQVNIVVAIEAEFDVLFEADQVQSLNSVVKLTEALRRARS